MSKYVVDTEVINDAVKQLRDLQSTCQEYSKKKKPSSDKDKGDYHAELISLCENLQKTWQQIDSLISHTIEFLGESSSTINTFDEQSANVIK